MLRTNPVIPSKAKNPSRSFAGAQDDKQKSECYAVLEDGDLSCTALLSVGLFAAGDLQYEVQESVARVIQILALGDGTCVEVDPVAFFLIEGGVGGDLHRGSRGTEGGAAPGGEEDDVGARSGEISGGDQVVARAGEKIESLLFNGLSVLQHPGLGFS